MSDPRELSFKDILASLEDIKDKLRRGQHSPSQGLSYRCLVFYADMVLTLKEYRVSNHKIVESLTENYRTLADVFYQYEIAKDHLGDHIGHLTAFGIVQGITQLIDGTYQLSIAMKADAGAAFKEIKKQEYWRFRNRHSHISTYSGSRSENDPEGFDTHIFRKEQTNARAISYLTLGEEGFISRTFNIPETLGRILFDITPVMEAVINHCKNNGTKY